MTDAGLSALVESFSRLTEDEKRVMYLLYIEGVSFRDAARALRTSARSITRRRNSAVAKLRADLGPDAHELFSLREETASVSENGVPLGQCYRCLSRTQVDDSDHLCDACDEIIGDTRFAYVLGQHGTRDC